jgi:hypothetical protein
MQCTTSYNIMHACLTEDVSISKEEEELSCLGAVLLLSGGCPCYYILHHVVCCCQICVFSLLQPAIIVGIVEASKKYYEPQRKEINCL